MGAWAFQETVQWKCSPKKGLQSVRVFLSNSCKTCFSFQILLKLHQPKWYQRAFRGLLVIQAISSWFSSFFSSISPLLACSAPEAAFRFPSRSCQILLRCFSVQLFSPKDFRSAHILKKEEHPRPPPAAGGPRQSWGVPGRARPKGACRDPDAVGHPAALDTRASLQSCLALQPPQSYQWQQQRQTFLWQSGSKRVRSMSCAKAALKR